MKPKTKKKIAKKRPSAASIRKHLENQLASERKRAESIARKCEEEVADLLHRQEELEEDIRGLKDDLREAEETLRSETAALRAEAESWKQSVDKARAEAQEWRTAFDCERSVSKHNAKRAEAAEQKVQEMVGAMAGSLKASTPKPRVQAGSTVRYQGGIYHVHEVCGGMCLLRLWSGDQWVPVEAVQ